MANSKKKAKRYSNEQKKEILDFIEKQGRGGQTKAVTKFKVTAATIASWRRKESGSSLPSKSTGASKELRALEDLAAIVKEITATEDRLKKLKKAYKKAKGKL